MDCTLTGAPLLVVGHLGCEMGPAATGQLSMQINSLMARRLLQSSLQTDRVPGDTIDTHVCCILNATATRLLEADWQRS